MKFTIASQSLERVVHIRKGDHKYFFDVQKHLLPPLLQPTQMSSELPESDRYIWSLEKPRPAGIKGEEITYL